MDVRAQALVDGARSSAGESLPSADVPADGLTHLTRPAAGKPEGLLVLFHGRGADERDLYPLLDLLDPKRRLLGVTPRGPLSLPPGGAHWYAVREIGYPDPATFIGSGKAEEIKALLAERGATKVVFDDDLTPAQVRNLEKIEAEINRQGLGSAVEMLGAVTQTEVAKILPTADCYIQSSVSEGIPVAIMEALACELPVVATNITGIPEVVLHGKTGLLVEPRDVKGTADALQTFFTDRSLGRELGRNGRELIEKEFNLEINAGELAKRFQSLKP